MLSPSHRQPYQELWEALEQLQKYTDNPDVEGSAVLESFQQVQCIFQEQVMTLTSEGLDPAVAPQWQSVQTEIHRAFRLLEMDVMFLQTSRKAATSQARKTTMRDRLEKMMGYCQALLQ